MHRNCTNPAPARNFRSIRVVLFGTMVGSMLPLSFRFCGLAPASASAPAVATIVDVSGLIIYYSIAKAFHLGLQI
jgi:magnesium transporter